MTTWTDEELMAYADGQLGGERGAQLAAALRGDAALRERVDAMAGQRRRVADAFADVLDEPVPDRLQALLATPTAAPSVTDLATARARREALRRTPSGWAWWGGMAASLALGVALGLQWAAHDGADALLDTAGGRLVAGPPFAKALGEQLGSDTGGAIAVRLSFIASDGRYCRTFDTRQVAGLACREAAGWVVQTTVTADTGPGTGAMRQAGSALPRAVLDAVDDRIEGQALNAEQERAARAQGWRR